MGILRRLGLLRRKKPTVSVFVDFEHWCYSLDNLFNMRPDVAGFYALVAKEYTIKNVYFFGDFTSPGLRAEVDKIRAVTNNIIDTQNSSQRVKKDFTDFIILDNMYQKALSSDDIDVFILFSGDGHFSSVTSFLKNFYHKQVVIYGVNGSFSKQLRETANTFHILPTEQDINGSFYRNIFDYLKTSSQPTYNEAINAAVKRNRGGATKQQIVKAMKVLMENDVISERTIASGNKGKKQKLLFVDWEKAEKFLP